MFGLHCVILVSNVGYAALSSKMRLCVIKVNFFLFIWVFGKKGALIINFWIVFV